MLDRLDLDQGPDYYNLGCSGFLPRIRKYVPRSEALDVELEVVLRSPLLWVDDTGVACDEGAIGSL
jgi:hypothetical protein